MKRFFTLCLTLALLVSLGTVLAHAETETDTTIRYGKAELSLTLIDPYDEEKSLPGFMNWGDGSMSDGRIFMECGGSGLYDIYNMTTAALLMDPSVGDHTYTVFAAENTSDGDIFFGFQPDVIYNDSAIHAYMSSELAKANPVKLVWKDGTVEDAKFWMNRSAGREVFAIPYEFEGYIVIPHAILATDIESTTPVTADGKVEFTGFGLHALPDDASYLELTITAAYACSALPAYEAPEEETKAPETAAPETKPAETVAPETGAPETAAPETTAPETVVDTTPETSPETVADTVPDTLAETEAATARETTPAAEAGCASVAGLSLAVVLAVGSVSCIKRRRND